MIRAVTLDFWNTLFVDRRGRERERERADLLRAELTAAGLTATDHVIYDSLAAGFQFFDEVWQREVRTPSCREILDATLLHLGADLRAESRERLTSLFEELLLKAPPDEVPGAVHMVGRLAESYRLAIISDTGYSPGRVLRAILREHGMLEAIDHLYFSDEGGRAKPDKLVFRDVLEQLGVAPAEAVHVGDIARTDIAGAHAAGMWAIHFVGINDHDAPTSTADALTRRLDDVPALIGDLTCPGCGRRGAGRRDR
ncbi:MAG: HAD family hydrolase [Actinobacteria bacterium]|nr:HAD family hydrolase [Actinomycetota bacterium]